MVYKVFLHEQKRCFLQTPAMTEGQIYHGQQGKIHVFKNTKVALAVADLTVAWKLDVVRGILFWLLQSSRNFSILNTNNKCAYGIHR